MNRSLLSLFAALAAASLPAVGSAQSLEFGTLSVTQLNAGNNAADVVLALSAGSSAGVTIRAANSNRGDYALGFGRASDPAAGVLVSSVAQNGRDDSATGNAFTAFYATSACAYDGTGYWVPVFRAAQGDEVNMHVAFGFFPYDRYLAGLATNAENNTALTALTGSAGLRLGTEFQNTATAGQYLLDLTALGGSAANGVLLVCGAKNEDNYALSRANADGTFSLFCHDNGVNSTSYEADPVAFVYLPVSGVGTNSLVALGRVNSTNGAANSAVTTDVAAGGFTVTKGGTGQWYLRIPGHSPATGTLLVSAEGGATNNADNIVSAQWDAANTRWVVESRDLSGETALPTLQNGATAAEDVFSFAFFTTAPGNAAPTVALTAPAAGTVVAPGATVDLAATAADADGTLTKVEFFDGSMKLGEDATAPYSLAVSGFALGGHRLTARATDNAAITATSAAVALTVAPTGAGGLFFDGVDDHVTFGAAPTLGLESFTLECWFRRDGAGLPASSGSGGVIAVPLVTKGRGEDDGSTTDCNYFLGLDAASGRLVADFEDADGGINHPVTGTTVVPTGVWQHAAVTFDAATSEWRLYLNGGLDAVGSSDGMTPRADSIQHAALGAALNSAGVPEGAFLGLLDEVRVWDRARTAAEIQASVNHQIASGAGLVARWAMGETAGTTLGNSAGAVAGTLVGGPVWSVGAPFDLNLAPTVAITAPADGAGFVAPGAFTVVAQASDPDGTVAQVEFLRDGAVVAALAAAPFELAQSGLPVGAYAYAARVTDNGGAVRTSPAVVINVAFDPAHPPANAALRFDGVDDYVTMGLAPELGVGGPPSNGFTIECWFLKEGAGITSGSGSGGVTGVPLFGKGRGESDGSTVDCNYFFGIDAAGRLVADFETYPATGLTSGQNYPVTGTHAAITNGAWHHAAVTYDGPTATWQLYLDGAPAGTATAAAGARPRFDSIQHFGIAAAFNSTGVREGAFAGRIDEVRVWNYARSAAEIAAAKGLEIAAAPGLVGRYGLNEGSGAVAANSTVAAGTPLGALTGNPVWVEGAPFATANLAPTVALTAPAPGDATVYPAPFTFAAAATDTDGGIVRVEFFVDGTKVGEDAAAPYTWSWTPAAPGAFQITARAFDAFGALQTSPPAALLVQPNPNQPTVVTPTAPADGATGVGPATTLAVGLADPESDATVVTFYGRKTGPATPGPDFTLIALPDTQYYSENTPATRFQQFLDQTNWIVAQRDARNIAFVSHMGDIVDDGDSIPQQWVNANQAMSLLEDHATTLRAYGIPFGAAPGNHDQSTNGNPDSVSAYYNQYFGVARYAGRTYWGGHYGANNDNNYQLFSASGLDFIIVHLEYRTAADPAVIAWADALLKAHPHRRAIVTSHWIIGQGNPAAFGGQGKGIYDGLKNNPNLFLLLCGHIHAEGRRSDTYQGRTVHSVLSDYQGTANGGSGFLRIFTFSPARNRITVESWSPTLGRAAGPVDAIPGFAGTFTLDYDLQSSVGDWIPLGTVNVPAGGAAASLAWTGLEKNANYEWYARVEDGINAVDGAVARFSTAADFAPTVALDAPLHGVTYTAPAALTLAATAADADGAVARVDFFQGPVKVGEDATAPYELALPALAAGTYSFSAVAVDTAGRATLSNVATITVATRTNQPPLVVPAFPRDGATLVGPTVFHLAATASDPDGAVTKVAFLVDGAPLAVDAAAPFAADWTGAAPGAHTVTVVATDNDGATAAATVQVTVVLDTDGDGLTDDYENTNGLDAADPLDADGDLDGDGLPNRLEYALDTPAHVPNRAGLPVLGTDAGRLTLTFTRHRGELTYVVRASDDLRTFVPIATNPGAVGQPVRVVDDDTSSAHRFLQLAVSDGVVTVATVPVGRVTHALSTGAETAVAFQLHAQPLTITGQPAGFITAVGAGTLDNANAGWLPGQLSSAAAPYCVRITRGAAAGLVFPVATTPAGQNTATRLTLVTGGVNLAALGVVPGADTYELFPAPTLATLFPTGTLQSGTATTGDLLRAWNGTAWVSYYHDGTVWRRVGAGAADATLVRPDAGWMLLRRGPTTTFTTYGTVSSTAAAATVARPGTSFVALLPAPATFAELAVQAQLPGWSGNPANVTAGDHLRLWNGAAWINYWHDGANWRRQGAGVVDATALVLPGRPFLVVRPVGAGAATLTQPSTY